MWKNAQSKSKRDNIPFNITEQDIIDIIPKDNKCPVLKNCFVFGDNKNNKFSMSLDKIIPEKGYIKGNIQIISQKANIMKNNATFKELLLFRDWINKLEKDKNGEPR